jgi:hypothetical protein
MKIALVVVCFHIVMAAGLNIRIHPVNITKELEEVIIYIFFLSIIFLNNYLNVIKNNTCFTPSLDFHTLHT